MVVATASLVFFSLRQFFSAILGIVPGNNRGPLSLALPKSQCPLINSFLLNTARVGAAVYH